MRCEPANVDANPKRAELLVEEHQATLLSGRSIICFPELFTSGYGLNRAGFLKLAETIPGPSCDSLSALSKGFGADVYAGLSEKGEAPDTVFDSSVLILKYSLLSSSEYFI